MERLIGIALLFLVLTFSNVFAATIKETSYKNNQITLSGVGDGEIQIVIFNQDKEPVYFATTTAKDGAFSITLPVIEGLKEGEHIVQVADYNGENTTSKTVNVVHTEAVNPSTGDNLYIYITAFLVSAVSLFLITKRVIKLKK